MSWLVFDYGGVISLHTKAIPTMAARVTQACEDLLSAGTSMAHA